jgi:TetR/AcrR family transcriptional repressor of uid operon
MRAGRAAGRGAGGVTDDRALGQLLAAAEERFDPYAERILEAAREELVEFGMRRTSLDDIARAAHVGRATLFRRFPNRDALMLALAAREAQRSIASVDAQVAPIEDPDEFLVAGALTVVHEIIGNELLRRLLVTDRGRMLPLLSGKGTAILTMGRLYMSAQLHRLQDQGARLTGDPEVISELLARLVLSLAVNPESVLPLDDDDRLEQIIRTIFLPMILLPEVASSEAASS